MAKKKEADLERDLKKEERCNKAFALQEERIKLEREKFEFKRELKEDKIIALDLSTMTFDDQQYYEYRKRKIRERRFNIQISSQYPGMFECLDALVVYMPEK